MFAKSVKMDPKGPKRSQESVDFRQFWEPSLDAFKNRCRKNKISKNNINESSREFMKNTFFSSIYVGPYFWLRKSPRTPIYADPEFLERVFDWHELKCEHTWVHANVNAGRVGAEGGGSYICLLC